MQSTRKDLIAALAMIVAGTLAFIAYIAVMVPDADEHPLSALDWVIGGALIGPGFGYLLKWSKARGVRRAAGRSQDRL